MIIEKRKLEHAHRLALIFLFLMCVAKANTIPFGTQINTSVIPSNYSSYTYQVAQAPYEVYFKNNSNLANSVLFIKDGYSFTMDIHTSQVHWYNSSLNAIVGMTQEMNPQNTNATTAGSIITYPTAWINTDLQYTLTENTLKETLIIRNVSKASSTADYLQYGTNDYFNNSLQVCANGVCYLHPSNQKFNTTGIIEFKDAKNGTVFYLPAPYVTDSANNSINGTYAVTANNGILIVNIRIPKSFIDNATFPIYLDPTITFSTSNVDGMLLTFLNGTRVVATYCTAEGQKYKFQVVDANGSVIVAETASSNWNCYQYYRPMAVAPVNSSDWITCLPEYTGDKIVCEQWHYSGTTATMVQTTTVQSANTYASRQIAATTFSPTLFGVAFNDKSTNITYAVQYTNGTQKCIVKVDDAAIAFPCGLSAYNSTHAGLIHQNYTTGGLTYSTYDTSCNLVARATLTGDMGYSRYMIYKAVNGTYGVAMVYDYLILGGNSFMVIDSTGANHTPLTLFVEMPVNRYTGGVGVFNDTTFSVHSWDDPGPWSNYSIQTYNIAGANTTPIINVETKATVTSANNFDSAMSSWEQAIGIGSCQTNGLAFAYDNTTTQTILTFLYSNGSAWDGTCPTGGGTSSNPAFSVIWNSPTNNTWNTSQTITHDYTPLWYDNTMANCSLWSNSSGSFALKASNSTPLTNNSVNTISFNYATDSNQIWSYINCTNSSGTSNFTSNYTIKIDTIAPTTPTLTLASSGEAWINLTIGSCTDAGSGVSKKLLYRNGVNIINFTSETTYNDTGLTSCTAYHYLLGCLDNVGWYGSNSTQLDTTTNHTTPPTTPTGLANTTISSSCIDLDWNNCTATGNCAIDTYRIFRNNSLAGTNTTSFFHECGLTNCTSYGYTIDVNDTGGLHSANSSTFVYTTNGCYVAPPAGTSAPNVTLVSPADKTNATSALNTFTCSATANNTLANATLYSNFTGTWQANETKAESGSSATESFTKTLTNGSYIWNCYWCNTINNCSFASANWTINVSITPGTGGIGFIFIQFGGGDIDMLAGTLVFSVLALGFAYFSVNQKEDTWKILFFFISLFFMYALLNMAIISTAISNQTITSAVYNSGINTYNFTYGNVTDTTPQQGMLVAMINPVVWVIIIILGFTIIFLIFSAVRYMTNRKGR